MQRWALLLAATWQHRQTVTLANPHKTSAVDRFHIRNLEILPVNCKDISRESSTDPVLAQVVEMVSTGQFPRVQNVHSTLTPFISRKDELTLQQGASVSSFLRSWGLFELHTGHSGIVKMKAVARSYIWWLEIDAHIEQVSKTCPSCQLFFPVFFCIYIF